MTATNYRNYIYQLNVTISVFSYIYCNYPEDILKQTDNAIMFAMEASDIYELFSMFSTEPFLYKTSNDLQQFKYKNDIKQYFTEMLKN